MINITFPDGSVKPYEKGITAYEIAQSISPRLASEVLAATVVTKDDPTGKGTIYDLDRPIVEDASIRLHKWEDDEAKKVFWHSSSHLMAEALESLYPGVKFGIGPAIENGFYYDVDFGGRQITEADLKAVEDKMVELARSDEHFVRREVSKAEAMKTFSEKGDEYKCELIGELQDGTITFYTNGNFTDLCRGPHLRDTSVIKAVKLTSIAGAYWRGDEKRQMLTRIYGITFPKKSMLDEYLKLMEEANRLGLECFSSPFDATAVDFMASMNMPAYKVASYEITDLPLIRRIARLHKPVILATGVAYLTDIERALAVCREEGNEDVLLMKCVSAYPTPYEDIHLNMMPTLGRTFGCLTGLSDHSMGSAVATAATALGARMIEKHLTLRRADGGPDGSFSMEPEEFADMVRNIRTVEKALGDSDYHLTPVQVVEHGDCRSLFAAEDIAAGEELTPENVRSVRPGNGLHTMYYEEVLGKKSACAIKKVTPMGWELIGK